MTPAELKFLSQIIKDYDLLTAGPVMIMVTYMIRWDRAMAVLREQMNSCEERLDDHEKRLRGIGKTVTVLETRQGESNGATPH